MLTDSEVRAAWRSGGDHAKEPMQPHVNEQGHLVLPAEVAARYGLTPGIRIQIEATADGLRLRRPATHLAKLYIEPTAHCNLACRTCVRNVWEGPLGTMTDATFERIIAGLRALSTSASPPTVFFGGYGEPLAHPHIVEMVTHAAALGGPVELITNGTLLSERMSRDLIAVGLTRLWVSLDGARPESYADVRLGAALPDVLANLTRFRDLRSPSHRPKPEIGIAFVAMKRNIADLPALLRLGKRLGASHFLITNLLPHTAEMCEEVLYTRALNDILYLDSLWVPHVSLPKIDFDPATRDVLYQVLRANCNVTLAGNNLGNANDRCPFIEEGAAAVGWDGSFSPCLPLLYSYPSFLNGRERFSRRYVVGNVAERPVLDLWYDAGHIAFRERVQRFEFSPCTF